MPPIASMGLPQRGTGICHRRGNPAPEESCTCCHSYDSHPSSAQRVLTRLEPEGKKDRNTYVVAVSLLEIFVFVCCRRHRFHFDSLGGQCGVCRLCLLLVALLVAMRRIVSLELIRPAHARLIRERPSDPTRVGFLDARRCSSAVVSDFRRNIALVIAFLAETSVLRRLSVGTEDRDRRCTKWEDAYLISLGEKAC